MIIKTGRFTNFKRHHRDWFAVFWCSVAVEIWFGDRYIVISL